MSAHTPGPWEVERGDNGRVYGIVTAKRDGQSAPNQDAESKWSEDYERVVAHRIRIVETDSGVYPPREADARLIAAAPELLDAVRAVADYMKGEDLAVIHALDPEWAALIRTVRDVLASLDGQAVQP